MHTIKNLLDHPITRNCARGRAGSNANETLDLLSTTTVRFSIDFIETRK
jgi:hypothetical protein